MSSADEFLTLFNKIEKRLDELNDSTKHYGFRRLVENLSKENALINTFKVQLIEYNQLRNALVHQSTEEAIAEPHPQVLAEMRKIHQQLTNPPLAKTIAASPVYFATTQTPVIEVIRAMNQHFYTSIPVYHDDRFVGVFSDHSITQWLAQIEGNVNPAETVLSQLQEFFNQPDDKFNSYKFMAEDVDFFTIRQAFIGFTKEKKRLGAVFLTAHGKAEEEILGIITAWDLPKMGKVYD